MKSYYKNANVTNHNKNSSNITKALHWFSHIRTHSNLNDSNLLLYLNLEPIIFYLTDIDLDQSRRPDSLCKYNVVNCDLYSGNYFLGNYILS